MAIYFLPLNVYTAMILLNPAIVSLSQNVTINNKPTVEGDLYPRTALSKDVNKKTHTTLSQNVTNNPAPLCHTVSYTPALLGHIL